MAVKIWEVATNNAFNTTLNGSISDTDETVTLSSVTGLQAPGVLVIDRTDASGSPTNSLREYITYTGINGFQLTGVTRGVAGSTAQSHNSGAQVEENMSVTHWGDLKDFLEVSHDANGKILTSTATITTLLNASGASILGKFPLDLSGFPSAASGALWTSQGNSTTPNWNMIYTILPSGASGSVLISRGSTNTPVYTDVNTIVTSSNADGWSASADTWTYASASTFTIAGVDRTSVYKPGTLLKFTQTSVKYAVVVSSSFSTDTTVTIAVNTDYTIANAAITSPYYSYQANPQGWPARFVFSCAPFGSGGSIGSFAQTSNEAYYSVVGRICHVWATGKLTNLGSWTGSVYINLPITPSATPLGDVGYFMVEGGLNTRKGITVNTNTAPSNIVQFNKTLATAELTWTDLATNDWYKMSFSYPF